ncbi:Uncharacterised protein [Enterobacter hormaechei]|nr:Uncharacterised protein [Enterobacter hormaechei]VAM23494.1 Uncharacterised protein [Enterobacter hormaechei]
MWISLAVIMLGIATIAISSRSIYEMWRWLRENHKN